MSVVSQTIDNRCINQAKHQPNHTFKDIIVLWTQKIQSYFLIALLGALQFTFLTGFAEAQTTNTNTWLQIVEKTDPARQLRSVPERRNKHSDYSVILNVPSQSATFKINICFEDSSADYGDDFLLYDDGVEVKANQLKECYTVTVPQNKTRITDKLRIRILKDDVDENYETVNITLEEHNDTPPALTLSPHAAIYEIRDILVYFSKSASSAMENEGVVNIPVNFNFPPKVGFTLNYTVTGTADSGSDYSTLTGEIEVPAGATSLNIPVKIIDDNVGENDETLILSLDDSKSYQVGLSFPKHTLTIEDNDGGIVPDKPVITISGGTQVIEGGNTIFTISANPKPTKDLSVKYTVVESHNFVTSQNKGEKTVTLDTSGTTEIRIPTQDDADDEPDGSVTITVIDNVGQDYTVGTPSSATVGVSDNDGTTQIINNNSPVITISPGTSPITEGTAASYTINAQPAPTSSLTVNLSVTESTANGRNFVTSGNKGTKSITIAGGASSATYTVDTVDDNTDEPNGEITVTINSGSGYTIGTTNSAMITVNDNDGPTEANFRIGSSHSEEGVGRHDVTVNFSPSPTSAVTLNYTVDGTATPDIDYTALSGTVEVPSGAISVIIPIDLVDDKINEPDETIILTLANGPGYTVGSSATYTFTITDDEPSLKITPTALMVIEGGTANYDIELTSEPSRDVLVSITEGPNNDLTLDSYSLTFTPLNWNIKQTVTVSADEDEDKISDRVMLTHEATGGTDSTGVVRVTIRDNDIPPSEIVEAGLVRFGRIVGEQSVSAIQDRLNAPRHIGFEGVFAGHALSVTSELSHHSGITDNVTPQYESQPLTTEEIVVGTSFALTQETDTGASVTFWGQGARSGFKGQQGLMDFDGYVTGFMLGWDSKYHNRLLGVMLTRNTSDILYHGAATAGSMDLELTAIIPYAGWTLPNDVQVWGALGFGSGDFTRLEDEADAIRTDIGWRMAALGAGGDLPSAHIFANADLTWHADVLFTRTSADPVVDIMDGLRGKTLRQRLGMEVKWEYQLATGTVIRPSLDVGLRHDDGDAETGLGVEIGGGMEWTNPEQVPGVSFIVKGRKLMIHDHDGFEDWGIRIALAYNSLPNTRRGFSSSVSHDLGGLAPEAGSVLGSDQLPGVEDFSTEDNWTAEVAYGISQGQGRVGTPYMAVKERSSNQATRLGYRLEPDLDQDQKYRIDVWAEPGLNNGREASTSRAGLNLATRW